MGIDFNKLNPEEAQKIINALKDGRINDTEAKALKLTPQEQEALNKAFSSGEVQIGDFVLVNKGKSKDGKKQYTQTKKAAPEVPQEEPGFFTKAWNKVKKDVTGYAQNFTKAWNNSEGFIGTTGALIGATTKTATDMVKNTADNVEKGVTEATGSETAGKIASHAMGIGFVADAAEAIEQVGDWSSAKIREVAKNYTGTERELLLGFADMVDDMNAADIALMFVGGAGVAKYAKDLPKILNLLKASAPVAATVAGVAALSSCSETDILQENEQQASFNLNITPNSSLEEAIKELNSKLDKLTDISDAQLDVLKQILENQISQGKSIDEILSIVGDNTVILEVLLDALTKNNSLLTEIKYGIEANGETGKEILKVLLEVKESVNVLTDLVASMPEYSSQLNEIINAINKGNTNVETLMSMVTDLFNQLVQNGDTQKEILVKLDEINNSNMNNAEKLVAMLELLNSIKATLDEISVGLKEHFKNDAEVIKYLDKILAEAKKNNEKADEINALLTKLLALVEKLGTDADKMGKEILNYIAAVGFEMNRNFGDLIDAVNDGKVDVSKITELLEKINANVEKNGADGKALGNQILEYIAAFGFETNANFNKVLDAINSGKADAGEIKDLLAQINANIQKNGADGKAMGEKILEYIAAFGFETNQNFKAVLEAINKGTAGTDELKSLLEKVLEKQDANTKAIIEAMGNIKIDGDNIDLSGLEKMMAELLAQSKQNGNILTNIDGKMDVLNVTTKAILAKLEDEFGKNDERYKNIMNILNVIKDNTGSKDDSAMLDKLDKILAKLDDILAAIKDHKVTVDVTGKVTCECNCGGNHEGILGDLEDILG